jgi:hypothetical protein
LVDLNSVVSAEERNDKFTVVLVLVLGNQTGLEPKSVLVVCEYLCHVFLGGFGLKTEDASQRIFGCAVTVERRDLVLHCSTLNLLLLREIEFDAQFVSVVSFSEVISIVDLAFPAKDVDGLTRGEIFRTVELFLLQRHPWVDCIDGLLRHLLP